MIYVKGRTTLKVTKATDEATAEAPQSFRTRPPIVPAILLALFFAGWAQAQTTRPPIVTAATMNAQGKRTLFNHYITNPPAAPQQQQGTDPALMAALMQRQAPQTDPAVLAALNSQTMILSQILAAMNHQTPVPVQPQYYLPPPVPTPAPVSPVPGPLTLHIYQPSPGAPLQVLPIEGTPKQILPIQGTPKQDLPIQGTPKQDLPIQGTPKQPLPIQGQPQQQLPIPAPGGAPQQVLPTAPSTATPGHAAPPVGYQRFTRATWPVTR